MNSSKTLSSFDKSCQNIKIKGGHGSSGGTISPFEVKTKKKTKSRKPVTKITNAVGSSSGFKFEKENFVVGRVSAPLYSERMYQTTAEGSSQSTTAKRTSGGSQSLY